MKYIARRITHVTGEVFFDVDKIQDNEDYAIVDAKNTEHAKELIKARCKCPVCNHYTLRKKDLIMSDTGQKAGETIVCDYCMGGQRDKE